MCTKRCRGCKQELLLSDFYANPAKDGYEADCKSCKLNKERKSNEIKNIYLILDHDRQAVKIGITRGPVETRLRVIEGQNMNRLSILATIPGTHTDEKRLHQRFAPYHLHHEWFQAHADILAAFNVSNR